MTEGVEVINDGQDIWSSPSQMFRNRNKFLTKATSDRFYEVKS